jgi:DHA1 family tetracycline resistance protein-like MFS transporter
MTPANRRAEWFVLGAVFLDMIGIGIAFPTLPPLVGEYTTSPSDQALWYSLLMGAFAFMQFFCAPLLGALSDHYGRRPLLLITIAGLALHYLFLAIAPSLWVLLFARLLGGVTGASYSVANAYLADISPPDERAKAFGKIGAAFGLGFIIGPVLGGALGDIDPHLPFYVAAGFSAVSFVYGYVFVKESLPPDKRTRVSLAKANPFAALYRMIREHALGTFVVGYAVFTLAHMTMIMGWVLFTQYRFQWGSLENGYMLAVVGVLSAIVQGGLVGVLVKRFGEPTLALASLGAAAVANVLYGIGTEPWMMYAVLVAASITFTAGPAIQGIVSKTTDPKLQGVTMGALQSIASLTGFVAPLIAGSIIAAVVHYPRMDFRVGAHFYLCAVLDLIALALIWSHLRAARLRPGPAPARSDEVVGG